MPPTTFQTLLARISLDRLHCYLESDGIGSDEPYLWTMFFKVDGDTTIVDLNDEGQVFLNGPGTFMSTPGSRGNLGGAGRDVDPGDDVPIPPALGELELSLTPITVSDRARTVLPPELVDNLGGSFGVVVALMEEESLGSDGDAEAGHAAFNRTLEKGINEIVATFSLEKREPDDEDIAKLKAQARAAVKAVFVDRLCTDHLIAADFVRVSHEALLGDAAQEIDKRLQLVVPDSWGNPTLVADYGLTGEILRIEPGPQIRFTPDSLDFGLLGIGEVAMRRLRIWNPGTVPVVVTVPSNRGGFFSWQALPATTVPSQSGIDLDVEFSPLGSGTARGVLTVEDTAQGSPHTIALSGRGRQETPN